ncbi:hypothetical protein KJ557_00285, partial [Patescibacteria group bacterium]|nr:hypothetical protein [Patescibacteria group bacterium]
MSNTQNKYFFLFGIFIFFGLTFFANSAQAGSVGTSVACIAAQNAFVAGVEDIYQTPYKGNLANFSCYDETNVNDFLGTNDTYDSVNGFLEIRDQHDIGHQNHTEFYFNQIAIYEGGGLNAIGDNGSNGVSGSTSGGNGSNGGTINIFSQSALNIAGSISANGGNGGSTSWSNSDGGNGGAGG